MGHTLAVPIASATAARCFARGSGSSVPSAASRLHSMSVPAPSSSRRGSVMASLLWARELVVHECAELLAGAPQSRRGGPDRNGEHLRDLHARELLKLVEDEHGSEVLVHRLEDRVE